MKAVRLAEERMLAQGGTKSYLPIDGRGSYRESIARLMMGDELYESDSVHCATAHTPGGTGALRIAGELIFRVLNVDTIWISQPTWANHRNIYSAAGLNIQNYNYLDENGTGLDFEKVLGSLEKAQPGQAILVHTVCHNPTGVDFDKEQWESLFQFALDRSLLPIFDFAYQGFGTSVEADAWPIQRFASLGGECIICNSFSKNFGLYGERVGGITAITSSAEASAAMQSQIKKMIRMMYSNPPLHGGAIVDTVLNDSELRVTWQTELGAMRDQIKAFREKFVAAMKSRLPDRDFAYVTRQNGMFSYSGLSRDQMIRLRDEFSIYALETGRINIAGLNDNNLDRVCDAIATVFEN